MIASLLLCPRRRRHLELQRFLPREVALPVGREDARYRRLSDGKQSAALVAGWAGPNDWRSVHVDRPETVDAFLTENPDCCRIVPGGGDVRTPTFLRRVLGQVCDVVEIDYVRHFVDHHGVVQDEPVRGYEYVSPCGTVVNDSSVKRNHRVARRTASWEKAPISASRTIRTSKHKSTARRGGPPLGLVALLPSVLSR